MITTNSQAGPPDRIAVSGRLPSPLERELSARCALVPESDDSAAVLLLADPASWSGDDLAQTAGRAPGRTIVPVLTRRFQPGVQLLAAAVVGGDLGLPWALQSEQVVRSPGEGEGAGSGSDVGPTVLDLLAEGIDTARFVLGLEIRSVSATTSAALDGRAGAVTATLMFEHDLGASITVGRMDRPETGAPEDRLRVMGNEGVLMSDLGRPGLVIDGGAATRRYGPEAAGALADQLAVAAAGGAGRLPTLADARAIAVALDGIRRSVAEAAVIECVPAVKSTPGGS